MAVELVLTCEHASPAVPPPYADRLDDAGRAALATHRASDLGALPLARDLAERFGAPLFLGEVSRLVVDLNRSEGHPRIVSALVGPDEAARSEAIARWWRPYRDAVTAEIGRRVGSGARVLHVSVHSFTPVLDGQVRTTDVGLLYDPARPFERAACDAWKRALARRTERVVHRNRPYKGVSDGFTTALRRRFPDASYGGVELEVNQRFVGADGRFEPALSEAVAGALADVLAPWRHP